MSAIPSPILSAPRRRTTTNKILPEQRVKILLSFPFSTAIREHTIKQLLLDPVTKELTERALSKKCKCCGK